MFSKLRAVALAAVAVGVLTFTAAPAAAFAATASTAKPHSTAKTAQTAQLTAPVTGTVTDAAGQTVGSFTGNFTPTLFTAANGTLNAVGTLNGTLTNTLAGTTSQISQQITAPAAVADPSCPVLNLVLGPLDLNLLGLVVHLNQVVLNITAQSGAGNLLGNLLCAVANLLNGTGNPTPLANLLNHILSLL